MQVNNQNPALTTVLPKSYQAYNQDADTGENILADKYLYYEGRPREYRFNAQNGQFNLYGERILMDSKGKPLQAFSFQPIAYRIFEDALFGRADRETWAEIFFIDAQNCVSAIMFNNTSVSELYRILEPVFYERMTLCDVVLTACPERVTSKSDPTKTWFISRFSYEFADADKVKELNSYAKDRRIFRQETISPTATYRLISSNLERIIGAKKVEVSAVEEPEPVGEPAEE
jgi:hypothetical protein